MSIRLTKDLRRNIVESVLRHRFLEEAEKLADERAKLAHRLYRETFKKSELALIESMPDGWLATHSEVRVNCEGSDHLSFGGDLGYSLSGVLPRRSPIMLPHPHCDRYGRIARLSTGSPSSKAYLSHRNKVDALREAVKKSRLALENAVNAATTTTRLAESWPEILPFLPCDKAKAQLPSINVKTLNEMMNLPVTESRKREPTQ